MNTDDKHTDRRFVEFRRRLHQFPELSGLEFNTAELVRKFVSRFSPSQTISGIGGTGLAFIYEGAQEGPTVMFRAELDALPIAEENVFEYRSKCENVSHKCGHDGHMTILAGMAEQLERNKPEKGRVILLFQPAEETGEGARAMINDKKFDAIRPDYIFALHNVPGFAEHQIICRKATFTPSVVTVIITLKGRTAHAAEPENGLNPAGAVSEIIRLAGDSENSNDSSADFFLVTPIHIEMGEEAYGTAAGEARLTFTLRAYDLERMKQLSADFISMAEEIAGKQGLLMTHQWEQAFAATENDPFTVEIVKDAAGICGLRFESKEKPFRWGEDFGLFTREFRGAMFGVGAGISTPALHNPDYDFPDVLVKTGVNMFTTIARQLLK